MNEFTVTKTIRFNPKKFIRIANKQEQVSKVTLVYLEKYLIACERKIGKKREISQARLQKLHKFIQFIVIR